MLPATYSTRIRRPSSSRTTDDTSSALRCPLRRRFHPSRASARAMPRPIPRVPPVMSAARLPSTRASRLLGEGVSGVCSRSGMRWTEECEVGFVFRDAQKVHRNFSRVVVAPLARLAAGDVRTGRHVIPSVRPVIHGVQQEPLMGIRLTQVRPGSIEQCFDDAQPCLPVARTVLTARIQKTSEAEQTLCSDRGGRAVDRLTIVEWIGRPRAPIAESRETRGAGIPAGNAGGTRRPVYIKISPCPGRSARRAGYLEA